MNRTMMTRHLDSRWDQTQTISQLIMAWELAHKANTGQVGSKSIQKRFSTSLFRQSNPHHQFLAESTDRLSCSLQMLPHFLIRILHPKQI
jgi:hypothetical protein